MFNILKKKTVELHFYTDNKILYDCFKIQRAVDFYPQWWKNLPKYNIDDVFNSKHTKTMKGCYGFLELYKKSFVIPLWADLLLYEGYQDETKEQSKTFEVKYDSEKKVAKKELKIQLANSEFKQQVMFEKHPSKQFFNMIDHDKYSVFKLVSPWYAECNKNINFLVSGCVYNDIELKEDITFLPGMFNFLATNSTNIFCLAKNNIQKRFIKAGTPLVFLTPMTESPVKIFCHLDLYKYEIFRNIFQPSFFNNGFTILKHSIKNQNKKCPF